MSKLQASLMNGFCLLFSALIATQALAQTSNGVWADGAGNYYIMLISQEGNSAVMFDTDLQSASVLIGSYDDASKRVNLNSLDEQVRIEATVNAGSLNGSITRQGEQSALDADLLFAYIGGDNDGIWQTDLTEASYFAYLTLQVQQASLGVLLDLRLDSTAEASLVVYSGSQLGDVFAGIQIDAPTQTLRVDFSNRDAVSGTYRDGSTFPATVTAEFIATRAF